MASSSETSSSQTTAIEMSTETDKSARGLLKKSGTEASNAPAIFGYIQDVGPTKLSAKNSEYFTFVVQQKDSSVKAVCFSPKKHKSIVEQKAESCSPCKVTKYAVNRNEKDAIWVRDYTEIDDAVETEVDFSYEKIENDLAALTNTSQLKEIKVYELVTVRGMILIDENERPQQIPGKPNLIKVDGCFVDDFRTIPITLWNEQIDLVKSREYYEFQNMRLRKYSGNLYLSSNAATKIKQISVDKGVPEKALQQAAERLKMHEIVCDDIQTAEVLKYYSCVNCMKKVPFRQDSSMLKCANCQSRFLVKSTKTTSVRISLKVDGEIKWYTLFSSCLEEIVEKYNSDNKCKENLDEIDEDKLCEIILGGEGMKLNVNFADSVIGVSFS